MNDIKDEIGQYFDPMGKPIILTGSSALAVEIQYHKALHIRAAAALAYETLGRNSQIEIRDWSDLVAELRKAAE